MVARRLTGGEHLPASLISGGNCSIAEREKSFLNLQRNEKFG
jgi:hypothetical protein